MKKINKELCEMVVDYLKDEDKAYLFIEYRNLFEALKNTVNQFNIEHIDEKYSNRCITRSKLDTLKFFKNISYNYYNIVRDGIKNNKIFIYPLNEVYNCKSFWSEEFKSDTPCMVGDNCFLPMKKDYFDLSSIIHECGHFIEYYYSMYSFRNITSLIEVIPVFFEKVLFYNNANSYDSLSTYHNRLSFDYDCLDNLLEYYVIYDLWTNKKLTFSNMQKIWKIENETDAFNLIDDILNYDLENSFKYGIGQMLANNVLKVYLDDHKSGIKILSNLLTKNGNESFIKSLNILGLKTVFNNSIVISDESIDNLINNSIDDINFYHKIVKKKKPN